MKLSNCYAKILFFLLIFNLSFAQEKKPNFEINISINKGQIVFESNEGCNFMKLSASNKDFEMNQNGMLDIKVEKDDVKISKFIFNIKRTGNKINLKGIKNTNWKELNFDLDKNSVATLTQNGVKVKE